MQRKPIGTKTTSASVAQAHAHARPATLVKPLPAVYALKAWSVKKAGNAWCIAPTTCFGNKPSWSKPYATLQGATTAIARKLAEEALARHKRRCEQQGINT